MGDIGQLENGIDILGVINMIQIFTLFEHLAECCDLPVASKILNWEHNILYIRIQAVTQRTVRQVLF